MSIASIEKLVSDRADQRTEEVFGLLISLLARQSIICADKPLYDLTIDGETVKNLLNVDLTFKDLKAELTYVYQDAGMWGYESQKTCKRIFEFVSTFSVKNYMDICFDEQNYLRIWK